MAFIIKPHLAKQIYSLSKVLKASQVRNASGHWYPYYKPGPYPKTEQERLEAAKKYNLLPEEYEPYPEGADGCGDYPKLPHESVDAKDPYYPFTNQELRRNFNEAVHRDAILLLPEAETTLHERPTGKEAAFAFCTAFVVLFSFILFVNSFDFVEPVMEKQFIGKGPHYQFSVIEDKKH